MMAVAVSAEMPEPSPLFWDHLSARVRTAVAEDVERPAPWTRVLNARVLAGSLGLIGAAAVLAMAVSMRTGNRSGDNRHADACRRWPRRPTS